MPREIKSLKQFLAVCTRKDARHVKILKGSTNAAGQRTPYKFKVRCSKFLYTFKVDDKKKAERLQRSIHTNVKKINITKKAKSGKRKGAPAAGKKAAKQ